MNMQELLTYVEELTFKTSMFGYDKDEVDIQLDKICDEAEAIILAKEKEIEELKKESKTALGIAAVREFLFCACVIQRCQRDSSRCFCQYGKIGDVLL